MKKLLLLTTIVLLSSCTSWNDAFTSSVCPCTVHSITKIKDVGYRVEFKDNDKEHPSYFSFKTKHLYNIGDTIK
jgi:hypothetical protein